MFKLVKAGAKEHTILVNRKGENITRRSKGIELSDTISIPDDWRPEDWAKVKQSVCPYRRCEWKEAVIMLYAYHASQWKRSKP
jgi:hypothetical protein